VEESLLFILAVFTIAVFAILFFFETESFHFHFKNQQIVALQTYKSCLRQNRVKPVNAVLIGLSRLFPYLNIYSILPENLRPLSKACHGKVFVQSGRLDLSRLSLPKYHIYVEYAEPEKSGVRFNVSQEELDRTFATPYAAGQPFWFMGRLLNPIKVTKVVLFWSNVTADKLSLPNQENLIAAKDKKYLIESIVKGKVKGAYVCTEKFLPSIEKNTSPSQSAPSASGNLDRRIIVVSGADNEMKHALTGALTKLSLIPLVMCEEPSQGKKIVEKFSGDYAYVAFAVVLLSPDDFAYDKNEAVTKRRLRPKQNVVFELGFLLGKLGKSNVLVFFRECANFEIPTDFEGVKVAAFDDRDSWKLALIRELTNCGYNVDADRILK